MKIAAIIRAHHKPEFLKTLVDRLSASEMWSIYIHVNRSSNIEDFYRIIDKSLFLDSQIMVRWSGFSMIEATLLLLKKAYENPDNTHFYLMSGQDFPLKSDRNIRNYIDGRPCGDFIQVLTMPQWHKPLDRLNRWHFRDLPLISPHSLVRAQFRQLSPHRNLDNLLHGMVPYAGSAWWLLSRPTVGKMLNFIETNPWYPQAFAFSAFADEMFFQTLFANLDLKTEDAAPTSAHWLPGKANPEIITHDVYLQMQEGWHFMARKFDEVYPWMLSLNLH
ncbi:beta-1,6-N-acetylglucosaminyltransferase [Asticcacaulis sp. ZE23SCel15]|uniref:beta-1,6-N-acetylglucosaminyltransferase n=1 Tax=Asticcacaulis sp. ZE23SCel15 TaxID=3059027 RepID=UPI00265D8030|nr:beta-1,6-N-acetylglucosaminyltransferase [Asticcacaulis sp. ZE23SCel15]WKL57346.1 beta-1,6-N-acetylglucosaminyltransferase [Asticcacaulis sp. ZE23SCel15]